MESKWTDGVHRYDLDRFWEYGDRVPNKLLVAKLTDPAPGDYVWVLTNVRDHPPYDNSYALMLKLWAQAAHPDAPLIADEVWATIANAPEAFPYGYHVEPP